MIETLAPVVSTELRSVRAVNSYEELKVSADESSNVFFIVFRVSPEPERFFIINVTSNFVPWATMLLAKLRMKQARFLSKYTSIFIGIDAEF